jgi:hypothetical protein
MLQPFRVCSTAKPSAPPCTVIATDRHGPYQGSANGFIEWAMEKLGSAGRGVHFIGNILIELHGDIAAVETYFQAKQEAPAASGIVQRLQLFGRYADRFEKREGQWRVAARVVIYDAFEEEIVPVQTDLERFGAARQPLGARGQDDPMYALLAEVRKQGGVASAAVLQTTESTRKPSK